MFRRLFGRAAPPQPDTAEWWREADEVTRTPDADRIARLRSDVCDPDEFPDSAESQEEMLDGLDRLLAFVQAPALPVVDTQHRVIGDAVCHFMAPASLVEVVDAGGKLFATADRLVFAAGAVRRWPWPTVTSVSRVERDVVIDVRGQPGAARLRLNSYGDALLVVAVARRLRANQP